MSLPVLLHHQMANAPVLTSAAGSLNAVLNAALVNGFNSQAVSSATASGGVVTFNFASAPGFSALDAVSISGASNAAVNITARVQSAASNQVLVAIAGVPDGAVAGTISIKFAPLGWTRPYSGTGIGCYRQGGSATHKRYLRVYDSAGANSAQVRGYEAMTAASTGTGPFPTTVQVAANGLDWMSSGGAAWAIVGTPRFFWLFRAYYGNAIPSGSLFERADCYAQFFGELAAITKPGDAFASVVASYSATAPVYAARGHAGASGAVVLTANRKMSALQPYPCPASGGVNFEPAPSMLEGTTTRGYLPGVLHCHQDPVYHGANQPGAVLTGISGVTGRVWLGYDANGASYPIGPTVALMLDEDWGDA